MICIALPRHNLDNLEQPQSSFSAGSTAWNINAPCLADGPLSFHSGGHLLNASDETYRGYKIACTWMWWTAREK